MWLRVLLVLYVMLFVLQPAEEREWQAAVTSEGKQWLADAGHGKLLHNCYIQFWRTEKHKRSVLKVFWYLGSVAVMDLFFIIIFSKTLTFQDIFGIYTVVTSPRLLHDKLPRVFLFFWVLEQDTVLINRKKTSQAIYGKITSAILNSTFILIHCWRFFIILRKATAWCFWVCK